MTQALIDQIMPRFDARSLHSTRVRAPQRLVYDAVRHQPLRGSPLIDALLTLRALPARLRGRRRERVDEALTIDAVIANGFTLLAERPDDEFVLGTVGKFWKLVPETTEVEASRFAGFSDERYAKAVWSFSVRPSEAGTTLLWTETRVQCAAASARRRFLWYWRFIAPFSGLIRTELLRGIRRTAERAEAARSAPS